MNTSRLQPRSPITVDGKDVRLITGVSHWTRLSLYSSALSITTVWSNYQTSYNAFFEVYINIIETVTLSPNIQIWCYHQFNFIIPPHVTNHSLSSLVKIAFSWCSVMIILSLSSLLFHAVQAAIKLPSAEASKRAQCTSPGQYTPYIRE